MNDWFRHEVLFYLLLLTGNQLPALEREMLVTLESKAQITYNTFEGMINIKETKGYGKDTILVAGTHQGGQ